VGKPSAWSTSRSVRPANSHKYEFGEATEMPGIGTAGFRCELIGHWLTEAVPQGGEVDVEVNHG